jgi:hypothetical protein
MTTLLKSLSQHNTEILLVLCVLAVIFAVMGFIMLRRMKRLRRGWMDLLDGTRGENLEHLLYDHLHERLLLQERMDELSRRVNNLDEITQSAKRHVGLVRYDAFEDVGGSQSFALAVYDDRGDGAILTSVVGRSDCRVYCKPLINGRSERSLSQEEQRAIQEAKNLGPKTIVSH